MDSHEPTKLVTAREARQVEPVIPEPDPLALKEVENSHAQATHKAEQGWLGRFCGSRGEKAGNIALLVIVACFILISVAMYSSGLTDQFFKFFTSLLGVIGLALGYLFGAHNKH